jgi:hypothetical protein
MLARNWADGKMEIGNELSPSSIQADGLRDLGEAGKSRQTEALRMDGLDLAKPQCQGLENALNPFCCAVRLTYMTVKALILQQDA